MTSTLFATTVVASFFVVGLPHVLPCPAPRVAFADSESADGGAPKRRRRKRPETTSTEPIVDGGIVQFQPSSARDEDGRETLASSKRECPVPKPKGAIGNLFGFTSKEGGNKSDENSETKSER